jgi:hypothetical protein
MDIWTGYSGMAIAFVILAIILMWIVIQTPGRYLMKAALIPPVVWFGVALYFMVPNLLGWPARQDVPDDSYVLAVMVNEPNHTRNDPGAIYLWINHGPGDPADQTQAGSAVDPRSIFKPEHPRDPRAYKVPYSREMHEAIVEAQDQLQQTPGAMMKIQNNGDHSNGSPEAGHETPLTLEIINPAHQMHKDDDP